MSNIIFLTAKSYNANLRFMNEQHQTISVRKIPSELWKRVRLESFATGKSVSDFVVSALTRAIGKAVKEK